MPKQKPTMRDVHAYRAPISEERTRVRVRVAQNTVDVGTHDIVIRRPRLMTPEEETIWPGKGFIAVDVIKVRFPHQNEPGTYSITGHASHTHVEVVRG